MKPILRRIIGFLVVGSTTLSADPAQPPAADTPRGTMPEIRRDARPLDRSNKSVVTSYADALEEIRHSVVSVASAKIVRPHLPSGPFGDFFPRGLFDSGGSGDERVQRGLGSGVIVSANGYILTNNHVVEGSDEITVTLEDGREFNGRVVGVDPRTDVAVVKIDADGLSHATLADSDAIRVGDIVFAVGNPLGVGQTTTLGIVSATGRSNLRIIDQGYENFIQTDASINPGNSGGALVDALGRVVGINTAILSTSRGSIGIGFAIPINLAAGVMRSLIETGTVARGFLGVQLKDLDAELARTLNAPDTKGAVIVVVEPASPADKGGLKPDDVIVGFNGRPIGSREMLRLQISQVAPGTTVDIGVIRGGENKRLSVVLGKLDDGVASASGNELLDGIRVEPVTSQLRVDFEIPEGVTGLVVTEADMRSRFSGLLPVGTVIVRIGSTTATDLTSARAAMRRGRNVFLLSFRGSFRYVAVTLR